MISETKASIKENMILKYKQLFGEEYDDWLDNDLTRYLNNDIPTGERLTKKYINMLEMAWKDSLTLPRDKQSNYIITQYLKLGDTLPSIEVFELYYSKLTLLEANEFKTFIETFKV